MINHSQQLIDKYPLINCTNCGTPSPTSQQQGNYIDDGISININDLGHYGGFTDNFPFTNPSKATAHLCHDCCVILFDALPGFAKFARVHGGHGNTTGGWCYSGGELSHILDGTLVKPCCPYAWTWDKTDKNNIISYRAVYKIGEDASPTLGWQKVIYSSEENIEDYDEFI